MSRNSASRIFAAVLLSLLVLAGSGGQALADTSSQAGVTIEIVDEGALDIAWGSGSPSFLVDGEAPVLTASTTSVVATATFELVIADSRADGNRSGYTIALDTSGFGLDGEPAIAPAQLMVVGVDGAPDGVSAATAIGQTLDGPVRLVTVGSDAPAINATLTIIIGMTIYAGTPAGSYTGSFSFEVLPLVAP